MRHAARRDTQTKKRSTLYFALSLCYSQHLSQQNSQTQKHDVGMGRLRRRHARIRPTRTRTRTRFLSQLRFLLRSRQTQGAARTN